MSLLAAVSGVYADEADDDGDLTFTSAVVSAQHSAEGQSLKDDFNGAWVDASIAMGYVVAYHYTYKHQEDRDPYGLFYNKDEEDSYEKPKRGALMRQIGYVLTTVEKMGKHTLVHPGCGKQMSKYFKASRAYQNNRMGICGLDTDGIKVPLGVVNQGYDALNNAVEEVFEQTAADMEGYMRDLLSFLRKYRDYFLELEDFASVEYAQAKAAMSIVSKEVDTDFRQAMKDMAVMDAYLYSDHDKLGDALGLLGGYATEVIAEDFAKVFYKMVEYSLTNGDTLRYNCDNLYAHSIKRKSERNKHKFLMSDHEALFCTQYGFTEKVLNELEQEYAKARQARLCKYNNSQDDVACQRVVAAVERFMEFIQKYQAYFPEVGVAEGDDNDEGEVL